VTSRIRAWAIGVLLFTPVAASAQEPELVWAKPDQFWYRRAVSGGNVWVKVDAQHGVKEPLFDHQRLATELSIRTGVEYTPVSLPFADSATQFVVKYDGSNAYIQEGAMAIEFILDGQHWRCDLQIKWDWNRVPPTDYECLPRRPVVAGVSDVKSSEDANAPRVSPDGRWEAFVLDHNIAVREAGGSGQPRMLTTDGTADFAWQPGSIRWAADGESFHAFRVSRQVWESQSFTGNVRSQVVRGEWRTPFR